MLAGEDGEEDVLAREDGRDRVDAARKRLAEEDHVGLDVGVVLEAEELARARETLRAREGASASGAEEWVRARARRTVWTSSQMRRTLCLRQSAWTFSR